MNNRFGDMARRLSSLYEEVDASCEETTGAIYSDLCRSGDRYTEKEVLARGGMKRVNRVFDTKTGRQVALAELRAGASPELYEPFLREARLTALLEHPNIISVHDIGLSPDGRPYFTMDLKRGDSLGEVIRKNKLSRNALLEVFIKLCDAISYAHSQKVMHLDLKPENIQIGRFGEVFICDWGLGKIAGSMEEDQEFDEILFNPDLLNNMTLSGELKGTPGYMAPEQFEKDGEKTDQTDVYALGCILYAILTQQAPLKGDPEDIQKRTLSGEIVSPALAYPRKSIPKALSAVTMKATAMKPPNRYPSVSALREDIYNYLSGFSTSAENAGFIKELILFYKRNRSACLISLFATVAIVVTTVVFIGRLRENIVEIQRSHDLAEQRRHEAEKASERYRDELIRNMRLMGSLSGDPRMESFELSRSLIYSDPVRALQLALQRLKFLKRKDPSVDVSSELGYCSFIMQDFAAAYEYFTPETDQHPDLKNISRVYRDMGSGQPLSIDQLVDLMAELRKLNYRRKPLMEKILVYDYEIRRDHTDYEKVIEAILRGWNQQWSHGEFSYDPDNATLVLRGENLKNWAMVSENTSGESPLRFLEIKSIDARRTGLKDLNHIKTLPVQVLDIRETEVTELAPLDHFPSLRELIISPNQFSKESIDRLPKSLSVRIR